MLFPSFFLRNHCRSTCFSWKTWRDFFLSVFKAIKPEKKLKKKEEEKTKENKGRYPFARG